MSILVELVADLLHFVWKLSARRSSLKFRSVHQAKSSVHKQNHILSVELIIRHSESCFWSDYLLILHWHFGASLSAILIVYLEATIRLPLFTWNTILSCDVLAPKARKIESVPMARHDTPLYGEQLLYICINLGKKAYWNILRTWLKISDILISKKKIQKYFLIFWYARRKKSNKS